MRLLDRYLLRELLTPLAYCLCGFLLFLTAGDVYGRLNDFRDKKLLASDIVEFELLATPEQLNIVLPVGLLLALLYALSNHARHNEITAIRAAGIGMWRISLPYFCVGFLASATLFVVNEYVAPKCNEAGELVRYRRIPALSGALPTGQIRNLSFYNSRDHRLWRIGVYDTINSTMADAHVVWTLSDNSTRKLQADRGVWTNGVWTFTNFKEYAQPPGAESNALLVLILTTNQLAIPQLTETPEQITSEIKLASNLNLLPGHDAPRVEVSVAEILNYRKLHPDPLPRDRDWLDVKLQGRLALPWTCLVVVFVAIPFGAASGRRNVFVGVASSIAICFCFFVLQKLGLAFGSAGMLRPAWLAAWLPNILFALIGIVMTLRVR